MDTETRLKLSRNLFPAALPAIEPWDDFPWHYSRNNIDSWQINSSQALAIDLFGTLKATYQDERNWILNAIAAEAGLAPSDDWAIHLEWSDPANTLLEKPLQPTQVDAVAKSRDSLLFFECKFTEDSGFCSQPNPLTQGTNKGIRQCNGNYELQAYPAALGLDDNHCTLAAKGIRYWELIPQVMHIDAVGPHSPCPFKDSFYQLMRNLTLAHEVATRDPNDLRKAAFFVVYADAPNLKMAQKVQTPEWQNFVGQTVRQDVLPLRTISYQRVVQMAKNVVLSRKGNPHLWIELASWIDQKIAVVNQMEA